jgi:hypothetical protein
MKKNLDKLKKQYKKLGDEIDDLQNKDNEVWYKIIASKWMNNEVCTAYSIFYVKASELMLANDYTILRTYINRDEMMKSIQAYNW